MSIYDQDFNVIYKELSPPDKRSITLLAWGAVMVKPLQWLHDLFFSGYAQGDTSAQYNSGTAYVIGDRVQYKHQVFECIKATTGNAPTDTNFWMLIQEDFRGADQRVGFSSQFLVFEYLLNQWFGTTFVQPVFNPPSSLSDIWIENTFVSDGTFVMAPSGTKPSYMRPSGFNYDFMKPSHTFATTDFIVHYPIAVIPDNSDEYNQLVSLVNQYKLGGTTPSYQSY